MLKKISIAIDAMGGDNSPDKTIDGINLFLKKIGQTIILYLIFLVKREF